jgi:hypothetical protein
MSSVAPLAQSEQSAPAAIRSSGTGAVFMVAGLIACLVAVSLASLSTAEALELLGIPSPGLATTYGLPAVQAAALIASVITIGSLLLAAFLAPPQRSGVLDVDGYRAVRTASLAAAV